MTKQKKTNTAPNPKRLRELIAEYWDLAYAEGAESRSHDTPAGDAMRVSAEIDKCIAALLQQLAERDSEVERIQATLVRRTDALHAWKSRAESAERAAEAVTEYRWRSVSDDLPERTGWYIGINYGVVEPLRWDGNNWHHTRVTRDLAMPSHWRPLPAPPSANCEASP